MKSVYTLFVILFVATFASNAQYVTCQSMPLAHGIPYMSSFGSDTLLIVPITNNSGTPFAYPLAKVVPVTALPAGMSVTGSLGGWFVFGSSWNDGQTNDCVFHYSVSMPIPTDYMFSFIMRVSNFSPLAIDSCYFTDTITVNLNPSGTGLVDYTSDVASVSVFPNPAGTFVNIGSGKLAIAQVLVCDLAGKQVVNAAVNSTNFFIPTEETQNGIYLVKVKLENGQTAIRRVVIKH